MRRCRFQLAAGDCSCKALWDPYAYMGTREKVLYAELMDLLYVYIVFSLYPTASGKPEQPCIAGVIRKWP